MARLIRSKSSELWGGYVEWYELPNGNEVRLTGSRQEIDRQLERYLSDFKSQSQATGAKRGRPIGSKNYRGRHFNEKDIKRTFGAVKAAISGANISSNLRTLEEIGPEMFNRLLNNKRLYNEYTGNLSKSYVMTVVRGRRVVASVDNRNAGGSNVEIGPRGGRFAELSERRHKPAVFRFKKRGGKKYKTPKNMLRPEKHDKIVRYLRPVERKGGYMHKRIAYGQENYIGGFGRIAGDSLNRKQSGIIIENVAPYADFVNKRGYKVLAQGIQRRYRSRWSSRYNQLYRVATRQMLLKAGFKLR